MIDGARVSSRHDKEDLNGGRDITCSVPLPMVMLTGSALAAQDSLPEPGRVPAKPEQKAPSAPDSGATSDAIVGSTASSAFAQVCGKRFIRLTAV